MMRLRVIIFTMFVGLGGLSFAGALLYGIWEARPAVVASMRVTMTDLAHALATGIEQALAASSDKEEAMTQARLELEALGANGEGFEAFLIDADRLNIRFKDATLLSDQRMKSAWSYDRGEELVFVEDDALLVLYPVVADGGALAYVGVGRSLVLARQIIGRSRWKIGLVGALIGAMTLTGSWWLSSRLTRSLERLAGYAQVAEKGERPAYKPSKALEIEQLARSLENMRKALDGKAYVEQYTQALAHALKAPLAGIQASSENIKDGAEGADRQMFLSHIVDESKRMDAIVEKLLRLASLESGSVSVEKKHFCLGQLAEERARSFSWAREGLGVSIETQCEPVALKGDPFWVGEAISEMLSNAVEFSPQGSVVRLIVERKSGLALATVLDDGEGIPEWALPRVKERFYSLLHPHSGKKGSGLGLALIGEVARLHGGGFELENRSEGGARAALTLTTG